jgi:CRISPR-associated protein Csc1
MRLYELELTFHDNLFYETRTLGRLYETGRLLHNIALCYALGFASTTYHQQRDAPNYQRELQPLNAAGIYVTPAKDVNINYVIHTFKYGEEQASVQMERSNRNLPTYGRAKEIAVGSTFRLGILSEADRRADIPDWIRMGIWLAKARVEVKEIELTPAGAGEHTVSRYPVNPRDLPAGAVLKVFDLVSMRPSSLVENALIEADSWWRGVHPRDGHFYLPARMFHNI